MKATEIQAGDQFIWPAKGRSAERYPERVGQVAYTVLSVSRDDLGVVAMVRMAADGVEDVRWWDPETEVPLTRPGADTNVTPAWQVACDAVLADVYRERAKLETSLAYDASVSDGELEAFLARPIKSEQQLIRIAALCVKSVERRRQGPA